MVLRSGLSLAIGAVAVALIVSIGAVNGDAVGQDRGVLRGDSKEKSRRDPTTCISGKAFLGTRPGVINFVVHCHASAMGDLVRFDLQRYSFHHPHSGIKAFSRRPSLTGSGASARYGVCLLRHDILGCRARANGRVKISGRIWVQKKRRCAKGVSLLVFEPPPCDPVCIGAPRVKVLTRGKPRGC